MRWTIQVEGIYPKLCVNKQVKSFYLRNIKKKTVGKGKISSYSDELNKIMKSKNIY
jgi:hypothetical protein